MFWYRAAIFFMVWTILGYQVVGSLYRSASIACDMPIEKIKGVGGFGWDMKAAVLWPGLITVIGAEFRCDRLRQARPADGA